MNLFLAYIFGVLSVLFILLMNWWDKECALRRELTKALREPQKIPAPLAWSAVESNSDLVKSWRVTECGKTLLSVSIEMSEEAENLLRNQLFPGSGWL